MFLNSDIMDKLGIKTFFFAIGNYSRFSILTALTEKDLNVSEIVNATGIEQSNVSHHMDCLLNCGFVNVRKDGKARIYSINAEARPIINGILKHIQKYSHEIMTCDLANREYISRVIE